jgi:hypothetical protein
MKELIDLIALPLSFYLLIFLSFYHLVLSLYRRRRRRRPSILYLGGRDCMELHGTDKKKDVLVID